MWITHRHSLTSTVAWINGVVLQSQWAVQSSHSLQSLPWNQMGATVKVPEQASHSVGEHVFW